MLYQVFTNNASHHICYNRRNIAVAMFMFDFVFVTVLYLDTLDEILDVTSGHPPPPPSPPPL